ncbi:MAG: tetratricopeptide repeat protein [Planctomycetota bacterium]
MRRLWLLLLLLDPVLAESGDREADIAKQFLDAHRDRDTARQRVLAAEPALKVTYPFVMDWLLRQGDLDAARALADARGAGPEGAGLERMVKTYADPRTRPTAAQRLAVGRAHMLQRRGVPEQVLQALEGAGRPVEGTTLAARIAWLRAGALVATSQPVAAGAEFARCARFARSVGWFAMVRDAERLRLRYAGEVSEALAAADRYVDACRALGDNAGLVDALKRRATHHLRVARTQAGVVRADALKRVREDYVAAIDVAKAEGERLETALLLRNLASIWHQFEKQPRRALKFYRQSLDVLREIKDEKHLDGVLFNASVVLTDIARYDEALALLDEMLSGIEPPLSDVQTRGLTQRAYVLQRQDRTEKATAAYKKALEVVKDGPLRTDVLVKAGHLHVRRSDFATAEGLYAQALEAAPALGEALVGRAQLRGMRGDVAGALADFEAALARAPDPVTRGRWLLQRAAVQRSLGRVADAYRTTVEALEIFKNPQLRAFPELGTAAQILGDLLLLSREYEAAEKILGDAAVTFYKLKDPYRAIDLYTQWMLVLVQLNRFEEAVRRLGVLVKMAETTPSDPLKSTAKTAEAIFEARQGKMDDALALLDEAEKLARRARDPLREATALVHRALLDPAHGDDLVERALARLDARRVDGPEEHPLIEGHRPDYAASVGVSVLLGREGGAGRALAFMERARADRLLIALGGREALLAAQLPDALHGDYVKARGRLREARRERAKVEPAEAAFDGIVARIRKAAPAVAALAFPRATALGDVQRALRPDELLLVMLQDRYVTAVIAIDLHHAELFDASEWSTPLDGIGDLLKGKRKLIVAPDGAATWRPLETARWKAGLVFDAFQCFYVSSAASFVAQRTAPPPAPGRGVAVVGQGPARFGAPAAKPATSRVAFLHYGRRQVFDLRHPQASGALSLLQRTRAADTVVVASGHATNRKWPRAEGVSAVVEALRLGGASRIVVSLSGPISPALLERFYDGCLWGAVLPWPTLVFVPLSPSAALREARNWARRQPQKETSGGWTGLVYFGVP